MNTILEGMTIEALPKTEQVPGEVPGKTEHQFNHNRNLPTGRFLIHTVATLDGEPTFFAYDTLTKRTALRDHVSTIGVLYRVR